MRLLNERPTERSIYLWNIVGSMANALISVVVLMLATRLLTKDDTDIFSLAWSISQLMVTIATFQIRVYQATDIKENFSFKQYCMFRIITIIIMLVCSAGYIYAQGYSGYKSKIVLIICIYRAIDSLEDVYEGWFQQKERLDLAGKALTYRIILAVIIFGILLLFMKNLMYACWGLVVAYAVSFIVFDVRYKKRLSFLHSSQKKDGHIIWIWKLFKEGFPLFLNAFIMMSITNTPKMVIDTATGNGLVESGSQTIFNILFMPASVLTLAYIVFRPLITQMAIVWEQKNFSKFLKILGKILVCLLGMAILLIIGSALLGIPVLSIIYGIDLKSYKAHLLIIILGGCCYTFAAVLDNALVVIRKQYLLIVSYAVSWIYIKAMMKYFVNSWKMFGASVGYTTTMLIFLLVTAIIFFISYCLESKKRTI
ncbi:lipopolysaccharide biosynthesis protein [Blautia sp. TF11-31AT]|jgi:O-antigen/teichoic acid export membrane protein|nr:lipopolysaccharide biosynthesis protein [Blautia sp. TF11-31AT]